MCACCGRGEERAGAVEKRPPPTEGKFRSAHAAAAGQASLPGHRTAPTITATPTKQISPTENDWVSLPVSARDRARDPRLPGQRHVQAHVVHVGGVRGRRPHVRLEAQDGAGGRDDVVDAGEVVQDLNERVSEDTGREGCDSLRELARGRETATRLPRDLHIRSSHRAAEHAAVLNRTLLHYFRTKSNSESNKSTRNNAPWSWPPPSPGWSAAATPPRPRTGAS